MAHGVYLISWQWWWCVWWSWVACLWGLYVSSVPILGSSTIIPTRVC